MISARKSGDALRARARGYEPDRREARGSTPAHVAVVVVVGCGAVGLPAVEAASPFGPRVVGAAQPDVHGPSWLFAAPIRVVLVVAGAVCLCAAGERQRRRFRDQHTLARERPRGAAGSALGTQCDGAIIARGAGRAVLWRLVARGTAAQRAASRHQRQPPDDECSHADYLQISHQCQRAVAAGGNSLTVGEGDVRR